MDELPLFSIQGRKHVRQGISTVPHRKVWKSKQVYNAAIKGIRKYWEAFKAGRCASLLYA